ncbi:carboxypeptidase-like regulatory domain-containing protein [Marinitoga sp. 38H-ov]|uniref:carboxypeptidase-like regulatory domain-containing protein n=1 Tax=Marinitoga sp. 38H-ov TaxID=1755814 RepID=UPI0013EC1214|nr:carboxypeptidase-like regulatory domain-containing protein [Marinitoga sp. 38H-ov]KAF2956287.1 hypothetical protein AS160_06130 [Marinitoga sp. 38H-ov]
MKKILYISISIFLILFLFSCQKIDPLLGNSDISGLAKLYDSFDYTNIKVSIEGLESTGEGFSPIDTISTLGETYTDEKGNFTLENIPAGNYILKAEKEGYFPTKQFINVIEDSEITLEKTLILYPLGDYGTLNGNVKYIDKTNHSGILIEIRTPEGEPLPGMYAFSDKNGNYSFDFVPVGNYVVYAYDPSENSIYTPDAASILIEKSKNTIAPNLILRRAAEHVVIFRDVAAWSSPNAIVEILEEIGFTDGLGKKQYEIKNSSDIISMSSFDPSWAIIIEGDQTTNFYSIYENNSNKFDLFVQSGGTIFWIACDNGWNYGDFTGRLPGGVTWRDYYDQYNILVNTTHPLLEGFPENNELHGNYASHGGFDNLDTANIQNLLIFIEEKSSLEKYPTYIEYRYGKGRVVASTSPLEFYTTHNYYDSEYYIWLLRRSIEYVFNLPISPIE